MLLIRPLVTNLAEFLIEIYVFSYKKFEIVFGNNLTVDSNSNYGREVSH